MKKKYRNVFEELMKKYESAKKIGTFSISEKELKFDFDTSTGWIFPLDDNGKVDFNKFGVDLRWRMTVMTQDINNRHKTSFNRRQIQNIIDVIITDANSTGTLTIYVDDAGHLTIF